MVTKKARDLHKLAYFSLMRGLVATHETISGQCFTITQRASIDEANRRPEESKRLYPDAEARLHVV